MLCTQVQVTVDQLWSDDIEVTSIGPGENVKVKLKGIEEEDVSPGFVLCDTAEPITTGRVSPLNRQKDSFFFIIHYLLLNLNWCQPPLSKHVMVLLSLF